MEVSIQEYNFTELDVEALLALPAGPLLAYLDSVLTSIETTIMCHGKASASGPVVVVCANCRKLGHCC